MSLARSPVLSFVFIAACGGTGWPRVSYDLDAPKPPPVLSAIGLVRFDDRGFDLNPEVLAYEMNTPLFSDFALKRRGIWLPPGATMNYRADDVFELPVGTILVKTFLYAPDLREPSRDVRPVETRLLVHHAEGWRAYPYRWRKDGSDADYLPRGATEQIAFIDPSGKPRTANYLVPQKNQCPECHEQLALGPIGIKARHLNRDNQLGAWASSGVLTGLPPTEEVPVTPTLDDAARDYLDINCAHCHQAEATAGVTSQLFLDRSNTDLFHLGVCKAPGSAGSGTGGRRYDLVPGQPDASILLYRLETETSGQMMPLLGRSLADARGVALIRAWITQMEGRRCN